MSAAGSANVLRRRAEIPPAAGARADWLVLTGVGGIAAFALVGIAWGISAVRDQRPKAGLVEVALDNRIVQVPAGWLREPSRVAGRKLRAIELVVPLPNGETQGTTPLEKVVLMRLAPADDSLPPEERAEQLYARFLSSEAWSNPGGLILRGFSPGTPYEHEELYLAPPDGRDFAARCPRGEIAGALGAGLCLWEFRTGGTDVLVSFAPARLADWQAIAATGRETAAQILKSARP